MTIDDKATRKQLIRLLVEIEQLITDESDDLGYHLKVVPILIELAIGLRQILAAEKAEAGR